MAASFVAMIVVSKMDYHFYARLAWLAWLMAVAMMVLTNFTPLGLEFNGQKRWLGVTETFSFQPAGGLIPGGGLRWQSPYRSPRFCWLP